jgi:hypothetical protein
MTRIGFGLAALLAIGCGGSTVSDDGTGGASGQGGSGGSGATGGNGASGGVGGIGGAPGGTGGLPTGGAGGVGGFGGTGTGAFGGGGGAPPECGQIALDYMNTLQVAKQCNPFIDFEQCTILVSGALPCGCPTFASSGQQVAVNDLSQLEAKWNQLGCALDVLCEPCAMPAYGMCQVDPSGNSGICADVY